MAGTTDAYPGVITLADLPTQAANTVLGRRATSGDTESVKIGAHTGTPGGLIMELDSGGSNYYLKPAGIRTGLLAVSDTTSTGMQIANTVTETNIWSSAAGFADTNISMPTIFASTLIVGSCFEVRAIGTFATTGTPTMQFRFGTTETGQSFTPFVTTGAIAVPVSGMSGLIEIYATFQITATGASSTGTGNGYIGLTDDSTRIHYKLATATDVRASGPDDTVSSEIKAFFKWGTASASNTVHFTNLSILRLR
jgi:hypothetical protein